MGSARRQTGDRHRRVERHRRRDRAARSRPRGRAWREARGAPSGSRRSWRCPSTSATPESCERFVAQVVEEFGGHRHPGQQRRALALDATRCGSRIEQDEREVIETNVLGLMRMTRLCVPHLVADGGGHIVNMGSVAGIWSYPERLARTSRRSSRCTATRARCATTCRASRFASRTSRPGSSRPSSRRCASTATRRRRGGGLLGRRDRRAAARRGRRRLHHVRAHAAAAREHRRDRADGARADLGRQHPARAELQRLVAPRPPVPVALEPVHDCQNGATWS